MALRCPVDFHLTGASLVLCLACAGCSQAVLLTHEHENGGVVTYLYKEGRGGPMGSRYRKDALKTIEKKCPSGYTVLNEGEMRGGYSSVSSLEGSDGEDSSRRWGLKFQCKGT
jgi:hypothetical protein